MTPGRSPRSSLREDAGRPLGSRAALSACQVQHVGYVMKGQMKIVSDDGSEIELGPGDAFHIAPGHDAWIVGDETCEMLDVGGLTEYAKA